MGRIEAEPQAAADTVPKLLSSCAPGRRVIGWVGRYGAKCALLCVWVSIGGMGYIYTDELLKLSHTVVPTKIGS